MFAARKSSRIVVYSKSASATWLSVAVGVAGVPNLRLLGLTCGIVVSTVLNSAGRSLLLTC